LPVGGSGTDYTLTTSGVPDEPAFDTSTDYTPNSQRFWVVVSDTESLSGASNFGVFSSSNTTAMDDGDPSESQFVWTVPAGFNDTSLPVYLTTNDVNQAGYGSFTTATGLSGNLSTAAAPTALYWDADHPGTGGTGTWNSTSTVWSTNSGGVANNGQYAWGTTSGTDYYAGAGLAAHFTGTAGTVTVGGTVDTYNGLNFDPASGNTYTLTSGTINLAGSSPSANAITVATGDTAIISTILAGSNGMTKNGTGTVRLDGANTYSGATTINAGTLQANVADALQNTSSITVNNGGSLLISATNSVGDAANLILNSGNATAGLVLSGNSRHDVMGSLTLSSNSVIDMGTGTGNVWLSFNDLTAVLTNTTRLSIWNYTDGIDHIYFHGSTANVANSLNFISFYSDNGQTFWSNGFLSGPELHPAVVPEPEVYATAALLLLGLGIHLYRQRRAKASPVAA
jgi:fibronectin-binding autotransporter adhesin